MWVFISCHLILNYLFNKNNPIPATASIDKKEMWQKTGYTTQSLYNNERQCS